MRKHFVKKNINKAAYIALLIFIGTTILTILPVKAEQFGGVEFIDGAVSFADVVISYNPGSNVNSPYNDPNKALGIPD